MKRGARVHRFFRRWEPYVGIGLGTGFFSWLARQLKVFGQLGWAESIFVGVFTAFLIVAGLALYRVWRPLPVAAGGAAPTDSQLDDRTARRERVLAAFIDPNQLYVAEISASAGRLEDEHVLEFGFRFFNASQKHLALSQVKGFIQCAMTDPYGAAEQVDLPPPVLIERGAKLNDIAPFTETMIVLQQHLPPKIATAAQDALTRDGLSFYFDELGILMTGKDDRTAAAVVPIDCGVYLRNASGLRWGRIVRLRAEMIG